MKVHVTGSFHGMDEGTVKATTSACLELGDCLARGGHTLVVSSDEDGTADRWVVQGASVAEGRHKVVIVTRDGEFEIAPFTKLAAELTNIDFTYRSEQGPRSVGRIHAIKESDAVIVIGGASGALQAGLSAFAIGRPVLAIPCFGGAAREVWNVVSPYYAQSGLTKDEIGDLRTVWNAAKATSALMKLAKRNPFKSAEYRFRLYMLGVELAVLLCWFALFSGAFVTTWARNLAVYGMFIIASFMGAGLRFALTIQPEDSIVRMVTQLINDLIVGSGLAFGFCLLYLAGGYVLTGDFVVLADDKAFARVAVMMSLLSFGAGFVVDVAVQTLRDRMSGLLTKQNVG